MLPDTSAQRAWEAALGRLQLQVTRPSFDTWLRGTVGVSLNDRRLVVSVPTPFAAEWLERRMKGLIEQAVAAVGPNALDVEFHVGTASAAPSGPSNAPPIETFPSPPDTSGEPSSLNARYTFDSFVVGECNQLAYSAAVAVADHPGRSYNPLFLYGGVGLGKTHLLRAIAGRAQAAGRTVRYVTCEQFTNDYLGAIRERRTDAFRARYRTVNLLLIDDIQFLCGKEGTQEGFFHTFNALHETGSQIVMTSDRPPAALPLLEDRLRSRLEWGLMADIAAPTRDTRELILAKLAARAPIPVPHTVIALIAERVQGNIRHIEGQLNRVTALAHFTESPLTPALVDRALAPSLPAATTPPTPKAVIERVAAAHGLTSAALLSGRRDKAVAAARQVGMYLLHHTLHLNPEEVGTALGGRDRTTVLYALKRVAARLRSDTDLANQVYTLHREFQSPNDSLSA